MENQSFTDQNKQDNKTNNKNGILKIIFIGLIILLILVLIFFLIRSCNKADDSNSSSLSSISNSSQDVSSEDNTEISSSEEIPQVGDIVLLGEYQQSADLTQQEPIQWRVLDVQGKTALLLSVQNLDCMVYHELPEAGMSVTWENSYVRNWLNNDFISTAFSEIEASRIIETTVTTSDNSVHGTSGGNDTVDRMFLLSREEVIQYLPEDERLSMNTDYARMRGAYDNGGYGNWLLRSPGVHDRAVLTVSCFDEGFISDSGTGVEQDINTVRPSMWIKYD